MAVRVIAKNSGVHCNQVRPDQIDWGEIAINFHASGPFLQVKDSEGTVIRVGGVIFQDEQPLCAQKGAWWYSHRHGLLYLHDGDRWIPISGGDGGSAEVDWNDIINRPDCFQPCAHTHPWDQVTDKPDCYPPCDHEHPPTPWPDIPEKPVCFEPCDHTHEWKDITDPPDINDGKLTIKDSEGDTVGEFTANQAGDTDVTLPKGFSGSWNDLTDKPGCFEPCDHTHALKDLSDTEIPDPQDKDVLTYDSESGKWTSGDGVWVDPGTRMMGVTDVSKPAPADPTPGDIWVHHDEQLGREAGATVIADSSWVGVAGEEFWEGEYVIFSTDDVWHHGGATTELNWDQIQNKPSCYAPCDHRHDYSELDNAPPLPVVYDGKLTIKTEGGKNLGEFTANQDGDTEVVIPDSPDIDAYTKAESDARFMPLDIRTLQTLY